MRHGQRDRRPILVLPDLHEPRQHFLQLPPFLAAEVSGKRAQMKKDLAKKKFEIEIARQFVDQPDLYHQVVGRYEELLSVVNDQQGIAEILEEMGLEEKNLDTVLSPIHAALQEAKKIEAYDPPHYSEVRRKEMQKI